MRRCRTIVITVIVTLVVVFGAGIIIQKKSGNDENFTLVRVGNPENGELVELVGAPGEIEPKTVVKISAKTSARIVSLPFDEGDMVSAGDPDRGSGASVLVRLDSKDLESQLLSARANRNAQQAQIEVEKARIASQKAQLAGIEAELERLRKDLERKKELLSSNDISESSFDTVNANYNSQKANRDALKHTIDSMELNLVVLRHNIDAADARIDQAKEALSYTTIVSPIDGIITKKNAKVGEIAMTGTMNNPGTVIVEVADLSQMLLIAQVDEADIGKIEVGQKAKIYVQAFADHVFTGVIDSIALTHSLSNSGTKYFRTEILLDKDEVTLYSGLTAHVDIETKRHEGVMKVPTQAVLARQVDALPLDIREGNENIDTSKTYATVVYCFENGKAVVKPVTIGAGDLTHTIIESGIGGDDKVVIGPYKVLESLKQGKKIRDEKADAVEDESETDVADKSREEDTV